jgi:hypothetical protein
MLKPQLHIFHRTRVSAVPHGHHRRPGWFVLKGRKESATTLTPDGLSPSVQHLKCVTFASSFGATPTNTAPFPSNFANLEHTNPQLPENSSNACQIPILHWEMLI